MRRPTIEDTILHDRLVDVLGWDPGRPPALASAPRPGRALATPCSAHHTRLMSLLMGDAPSSTKG